MSWLASITAPLPDWPVITTTLPFAPAMAACPQDAVHHAEGDVWTHTRMVVEALEADQAFQALPAGRRRVLRLAAFLHDIAKPATTVREWDEAEGRERIRQPGHARRGARMAWHALWKEGEPLADRLGIYWLIAWHQRVFHLWAEKDMLRAAISFSLVGHWRELLILARADNRGRISPNSRETEEALTLLELWLGEHKLLDAAWPFPDSASQREFLEKPGRSPYYATQPAQGSRVIVLAGLPGAGKDSYARATFGDIAMISLDTLRAQLDIGPEDEQGAVIQAAFEMARGYLRAGRAFVWNATSITRTTREKIIGLARAYDAYVAVHVVERPLETILRQNRQRQAAVPSAVIQALAAKWEPPSVLEAHEVLWV